MFDNLDEPIIEENWEDTGVYQHFAIEDEQIVVNNDPWWEITKNLIYYYRMGN